MQIHILGHFPDILDGYFSASLIGKAKQNGLLAFFYHQIRDWSDKNYGSVDDKTYGGGTGLLMRPDIVCRAVRDLKKSHAISRVIFPTPTGKLLTGGQAKELAQCENLLFLCGRYEGVDQRAIDAVVDDEISIGDYVLSGGELATAVIIDALARFIPGVVAKQDSVTRDSFEDGLLEAPQFTRPEIFEGVAVPPVLLSGNHEKIAEWRRLESLRLTWRRRPDLFKHAKISDAEKDYIMKFIHGK